MTHDLRRRNETLLFHRISHEQLQSCYGIQPEIATALSIITERSLRKSAKMEYERIQQEITSTDDDIARLARIKRDECNEKMENDIEIWAKKHFYWVNNTNKDLQKRYGDKLASGCEAVVYFDEENKQVIKAQSTWTYSTLKEKLEAILLHNYIFPDTAYTLHGFGLSKNGEFQVLVTQPYIYSNDIKLSQLEINQFALKIGFKKDTEGNHNYTNGNIKLRDLHNENIMMDHWGNVRVIDNIIRLT